MSCFKSYDNCDVYRFSLKIFHITKLHRVEILYLTRSHIEIIFAHVINKMMSCENKGKINSWVNKWMFKQLPSFDACDLELRPLIVPSELARISLLMHLWTDVGELRQAVKPWVPKAYLFWANNCIGGNRIATQHKCTGQVAHRVTKYLNVLLSFRAVSI